MGVFKFSKKNKDINEIEKTSNDINDTDNEYTETSEDSQENNTVTEDVDEENLMLIDNRQPAKSNAFETQDDINNAIDRMIDYFTEVDPIQLNMLERGKINQEHFDKEAHTYLKKQLKLDEDSEAHKKIYKGFMSFIISYDVLDPLIADDEISDIKCYDWNKIRIKRKGKRMTSDVTFRNERDFLKFVDHVAVKNKVSISDQNALQNFVDTKSSKDARLRFNISTGFVNSSEKPILSIRKTPKQKPSLDKLIEDGLMTREIAAYLERRVVESGGMLFTGQGGSGKTTCMNYLIDFIPDDKSGLVIQENDEMFSYTHPDLMFEHTVMNRGEGKIEYNLGDLARNGLLADIDYFVIGEIKGAEALYLLNAVYTGAKGWASVHGASSTEAMKKLVDYIKYNSNYTQAEALQMLTHLDTVIFLRNYKVWEISEVSGYDEEHGDLTYRNIVVDGKFVDNERLTEATNYINNTVNNNVVSNTEE